MYKLQKSIIASTYTAQQLFLLAETAARDLIERWELKNPVDTKDERSRVISIVSHRFVGTLKADEGKLTVEGTFKEILRLGKGETEEQLNDVIQSLFHSSYDL